MPTYSFKCRRCEKVFDQYFCVVGAKYAECPDCRWDTSDRIFATSPGVLAGPVCGWKAFQETTGSDLEPPADHPEFGTRKVHSMHSGKLPTRF
jgi:putative FmdB family regulatory protein